MMTRRKTVNLVRFAFILGFFAFLSFLHYNIPFLQTDPFLKVKKYTPIVRNELSKYDLEEYTYAILAIMQQESHGVGGDPMQSSESIGLSPNSIEDPEESIKIGVKHFKNVLNYGLQEKVDLATVIQAYNMGPGYIDYVSKHGGKHSEELAKKFSLLQVDKNPIIYQCKKKFFKSNYPYCYGDYKYSNKVTKNIKLLKEL